MKAEKYMEEDDMVKKAISVLIKEIGPIETNRFINITRKKRIESVNRHREWQKLLNNDKFFDEVFKD